MREYKGREITATTAMVKNAGDGLSDPLKVDEVELDYEDRVFVILDCSVEDFRYPKNKKDPDTVSEKIVFSTVDAMLIPQGRGKAATAVKKMMQENRHRVSTALASMKGQESLDLEDDD